MFDTYWRFAAARQALYEARLQGRAAPWTEDPILRRHRFTNCYRAADRVSQFLISQVIYQGPQDPDEVVFRTLLFKVFNRIPTWQRLEALSARCPGGSTTTPATSEVLSRHSRAESGSTRRLTSCRHRRSARRASMRITCDCWTHDGRPMLAGKVRSAGSMAAAFEVLRRYPAIGDFLAYQYVIDLNYSPVLDVRRDGVRRPGAGRAGRHPEVLRPAADGIEAEVIRYMADRQEEHFARLGLAFAGLRGPPAAADRLPEPVLRGRQVRSRGTPRRPGDQRAHPDQAVVPPGRRACPGVVPAQVGHQRRPDEAVRPVLAKGRTYVR